MRVRHLVAAGSVRDGVVVDPSRVCHGAIRAGRVVALAGPVDPATHLNLDFPEHRLGRCVVVERLEPGAAALVDAEGRLRMAEPPPGALRWLGRVDVGRRRAVWSAALAGVRSEALAGVRSAALADRVAQGGVGR